MGINRNADIMKSSLQVARLQKRIWWSCVMRDRLLALGMKKALLIDDQNYDVQMLSLDDFEISSSKDYPDGWDLVGDVALQKDMAILCIAKVKICLCIGHVLQTQYTEFVRDQGMETAEDGRTLSRALLHPRSSTDIDSVRRCEVELSEWMRELPPVCQYVTPKIADLQQGSASLTVDRALIHMVYCSTSYTLHQPQVRPKAATSPEEQLDKLRTVSREKLRISIRRITQLVQDLCNLNLIRYLPATAVTVLFPQVMNFVADIKSSNDRTRDEAVEGLSGCVKVLRELQNRYGPADDISEFVELVIARTNIELKSDTESSPENSTSDSESSSGSEMEIQGGDPPAELQHDMEPIHWPDFDVSQLQDCDVPESTEGYHFEFENPDLYTANYINDLSFLIGNNGVNPGRGTQTYESFQ